MDKHTFIGKRKVGSTDICDFTDYQGIGRDPLYKRYESVYSIIKKYVSPQYVHFLASPDYSPDDDTVNWYIGEWNETPEILTNIQDSKKEKYYRIKEETVSHYKDILNNLTGEEFQVMACALRYIDDDFIFCCDDKVFVVAWGMTPDARKHISKGELVHESPFVAKYKLTFDKGEHGNLSSKFGQHISLPEGAEVSANDIPTVVPYEGFIFSGWKPSPLGLKVMSDMTFVAQYDKTATPSIATPVSSEPQIPKDATCRFDAGDNGILVGNCEVRKVIGSRLLPNDIPIVKPNKGFTFKGWDKNPFDSLVKDDIVYHAVYEQYLPWYKRVWLWLTGSGCLKWLLYALLIILLFFLLSWLFKDCHGCTRSVSGVAESDRIITSTGDTIDDNGVAKPISLHDGKLPDSPSIVAPIRNEDGVVPSIERAPGLPPVVANRLFLFLEDEDENIDVLASEFKRVYPGEQYAIIGFDRDVKSLLIQVPENERDDIRRNINSKIPNHKFLVFDEEIYELNGHQSTTSFSTPGWHLNAVKAQEGWQICKGSPSVIVAVIDDGIDSSHPMFKGRIVNAYNVYSQNNSLSKGEGHGTHTAGLAVGSLEYQSQGAAGIAPDCMLMPVQVIDNNMCPLSALVSGVMYSIHKGADVVNISIGPSFQGLNQLPIELQNQIAQTQFKNVEKLWNRVCKIAANKNVILVFAAGNDDILSSIPPENRTSVAITVGAVDQKLYPTDFTNYGPCTDISAPGKEIYSSYPIKDFRSCDGTSMAAPIVSGAVALMKSLKMDLTVEQARNVLYKTGCNVYGNLPPMVQVNLALEAVKRGDFSSPTAREIRPVPATAIDTNNGDTPSSWTNPDTVVVAGHREVNIIDNPSPIGDTTIPITGNESDYDAIRRLIAIYKQKISELEGQLPENKR